MSKDNIHFKVNPEERERHEWLKDFFGYRGVHGEDSQTVKQSQIIAFNVLRMFFGDNIKDIFKRVSRDDLIRLRAIQQEKIRKGNIRQSQNRGKGNTNPKRLLNLIE